MRFKYIVLLLAFLGTVLAVIWQESNLSFVKESVPEKTENGFIRTTDDASYLQPPINWKETGVWKDKSKGNSSYYQRPPGYGFVFLISSYLSPSNPYIILKVVQILGFFLSILLVAKLLLLFGLNHKWTLFATALFALLPCFSGLLYHTLTEGITPVLLLWSLFEWVLVLQKEEKTSVSSRIRWIVSNSFLLLVRPQLIVFALIFMLYLLFKRNFKAFAWSLILMLPFAIWQIRIVSISGTVDMHPIYSENNQSFYRAPHEALGELFKIWEFRSDHFHETVALLLFDPSEEARERALLNIPDNYRTEVEGVLEEFQNVSALQVKEITKGYLDHELPEEKAFVANANALTSKLAKSNVLDAYVKTPIRSAKELFVNSHLHLTIFQSKYRGAIWMEVLRWSSLLVVLVGIFALFKISALAKSAPTSLWLICLSSVITILYLVFVQRLNEERYLTPILPLAFIAAIWMIHSFVRQFKS